MDLSYSTPDAAQLLRMMDVMQMGWWTADFEKKTNEFSPVITECLGLKAPVISFDDFIALIRPDYRVIVAEAFASILMGDAYEHIYPVMVDGDEVWVRSKLVEKQVGPGEEGVAWGSMQIIKMTRSRTSQQASEQLDLMTRSQNDIYTSLLAFLGTDDISSVIQTSLKDILSQFGCSHIGMFEYDHAKQTQRCTCTVSDSQAPELVIKDDSPIDITPWLSGRMLARLPVMVSDLDELPEMAGAERQLFAKYGTRSVIAVPLVGIDRVWGYIEMDSNQTRQWSSEDLHLFASVVGVIGICLQFHASEKKMRQEQQHIRNLYKYMPAGYVRLAVTGGDGHQPFDYTYLDANRAASRILETSMDELVGRKASQTHFIADGQLDAALQSIEQEKEVTTNFYIGHLDKHCYGVLFTPAPGEVAMLFTDETESIKTQLRLEQNEGQLRNIYQNLPVGIELYDSEGYLVDMNEKECEIFGLSSKNDALGVNVFENPNIPDAVKEKLRLHEQVEFRLNYDFSIVGDYYDTMNERKIYLVTIATPLFNSKGEFINYIFINIDNTDTTTAHQQIEAFREMTSLIGEYAQVGYATFDAYTREGTALDSWYRNFGEKPGIPLSQVVGVLNHVIPEDKAATKEFFDKVKRGEAKHLRHDVRVMQPEGGYRWVRLNLMVRNYNPEEQIIGMVCVNYDITALKQTEQNLIVARDKAETSDRLKTAFLANMSHEIRTPLNAIIGFSSILAETEQAEQRREYLSIVQENNELLLQLISDILDISKIEAGTMEFTSAQVDVRQLCQEVVQAFSLKAPEGVEMRFDRNLPQRFVTGDKNRMNQVISNFMTNALKFTEKGSVTLSYDIADDGQIRFCVTDTGKGIAPEKQAEVFSRFVKLDSFAQGTGLGLSICQSLVERMGGGIGVESEEGRGSCFWFTHPYAPEAESAQQTGGGGKTDLAHAGKNTDGEYQPLILVAEDIDSNFLLIETLLKKDYRLLRASTGSQAVELFNAHTPDLILMDMKMPGMDGLQATTVIRQQNADVPIVALTAFAYDSDKELAFGVGCNDFLTKPISPPELRRMVEKWTAN